MMGRGGDGVCEGGNYKPGGVAEGRQFKPSPQAERKHHCRAGPRNALSQ